MKNAVVIAAQVLFMISFAAQARCEESDKTFSGSVAFLSDNRGRGISDSDKESAVQAAFDAKLPLGFAVGVEAASIAEEEGATSEFNVYGTKTWEWGETEVSVGASAYLYPNGHDLNYGELLATASRSFGPLDLTVGANYAWSQKNIGDGDDTYVYAQGAYALPEHLGVPLTLNASLGYEEGVQAVEDEKLDWSMGVAIPVGPVELGATYIDTDLNDEIGSSTVVFSLAHNF